VARKTEKLVVSQDIKKKQEEKNLVLTQRYVTFGGCGGKEATIGGIAEAKSGETKIGALVEWRGKEERKAPKAEIMIEREDKEQRFSEKSALRVRNLRNVYLSRIRAV